jgi:hypothetical protein
MGLSPNVMNIIQHPYMMVVDVNTSHTPEKGAHSPSWPNGLIIIVIIIYGHTITDAHPKIRVMSPLLILISCIRNSLIHEFVNSVIHNSLTSDHCFSAICGQLHHACPNHIFSRRNRSIISTYKLISR